MTASATPRADSGAKRPQWWAWVSLGIGMLIVLLNGATWVHAELTSPKGNEHTWHSGSPLHLVSLGVDAAKCTVSPESGEARQVEVAPSPPRRRDVGGARLTAWFSGMAHVSCDMDVKASSGPLVSLYWFGEQGWLILIGALLVAIGWVYGLRRLWTVRKSPRT